MHHVILLQLTHNKTLPDWATQMWDSESSVRQKTCEIARAYVMTFFGFGNKRATRDLHKCEACVFYQVLCCVRIISGCLSCSWTRCHVYIISVVLSGLLLLLRVVFVCSKSSPVNVHFAVQVHFCVFMYIYNVVLCF